jgi:Protein of unknown function (DUF2613)
MECARPADSLARARRGSRLGCHGQTGRRRVIVTRVSVIVASIVAGILLAAGAAYGVTAIATGPQTPANQNPHNYGPP